MSSEDTEIVVIYGKRYQVAEWDMKDHDGEYVTWELFATPLDEAGDEDE